MFILHVAPTVVGAALFLALGTKVAKAFVTAAEITTIRTVPQYVLDYAPLVYLYSTETYQPSDIAAQLVNTHPTVNGTPVAGAPSPLTLDNLDQLNAIGGANVYLSSNQDFTKLPPWLHGVKPDVNGKTQGATSSAIIVHDKGNSTVDAFYMFFFAYNQGNKLLGIDELGDHVGDWEHSMIRFVNGAPSAVWFSQHANGAAYTYSAVEKQGKRVVAYSGNGTHATWGTSGTHDHSIPNLPSAIGPLIDYTSKGSLWDPTLSAYYYTVTYPNNTNGDNSSPTFAALPNPLNASATTPVNWLYFQGQWGDDQLPKNDPRQKSLFGVAYKYTAGPNGPRFKQLNRVGVCPSDGQNCIVRTRLVPGS